LAEVQLSTQKMIGDQRPTMLLNPVEKVSEIGGGPQGLVALPIGAASQPSKLGGIAAPPSSRAVFRLSGHAGGSGQLERLVFATDLASASPIGTPALRARANP
jgi:hypothetical protein